ncbi:pirin family protein [Pseudomonas sp. PDM19]|uniref:pirin family protein n=1 Tax=Pseudomonas sp. PDM19 TaxID=2769272 RepID=UPI00178151B6|nr:pirin-like C-terminal cupin domain-containing protein [Pseudomonas sp. PDM19]MBD9631554.1 pirin family protein [Pseudomonas sp. PDM19]
MTSTVQLQRMSHGEQFRAFTLRGGTFAEPIDPFLAVDHAWISGPTFPPHPHAGFSAVSYLFDDSETAIDNEDSLGNRNLIQPGGLHWTAAGSGVVHEEVPAEVGRTVHMLQIFINLPQAKQGNAPFALSLAPEDVPVVRVPGAVVRVPLGSFADANSPLTPPTNVRMLDISLEAGTELSIPLSDRESAFVMPISGEIRVDGLVFDLEQATVPVIAPDRAQRHIALQAGPDGARVVVFSGVPLHQSVYWKGPFALASMDALAHAVASYQKGLFGKLQPR